VTLAQFAGHAADLLRGPPCLRRRLEHDRTLGRRAVARRARKAGADMRAKYVAFRCDDPISYSSSIDMATALHPQTILCLTYAGRPIEPKFGARCG